MKASITKPAPQLLDRFLDKQEDQHYSYQEVGQTRHEPPQNYDNDHHSINLGTGEAVWQQAKIALQQWQQFPPSWTQIYPANAPLYKGTTVAVVFKIFGTWWTNSARIVYDFDENNRYGFAYGTLPGHVEKGEEVFWIERDQAGLVSYHIKAFSKPAHWLIWLGYPVARAFQRPFCRQSMNRMKQLVSKST